MNALNRFVKIGFLLIALFCNLASDGQNKKAKKFYEDGMLSFDKADYGLAIVNFTEAIKAYSSYAIAYQSLGRSYYITNNFENAVLALKEAIKYDPKNQANYYWRGSAYYKKNTHDSAITDLKISIEMDPTFAPAYQSFGELLYIKQNYDSSINVFTQAIKLDPKNKYSYYWRGKAYRMKKDIETAIADEKTAVQIDPTFELAHQSLGEMWFDKQNYDLSIKEFTEAIKSNTRNHYSYYYRASAFFNKNDLESAKNDLLMAIQLNPNLKESHKLLGKVCFVKKEYSQAIKEFTAAGKLDSKDKELLASRGEAYSETKEYDLAILDFTEAIKLDPNYAFAFFKLGIVYFYKQNFDQAIITFTEAIKLNPQSKFNYKWRGETYDKKNNLETAIEDLKLAIQLDPSYYEAHTLLGTLWYKKGNDDLAIKAFTEAIKSSSKDPLLYVARGNSYSRLKEYDLSILDYNEAIKLNPTMGFVYSQLGTAYFFKENFDQAIKFFTEAIKLNPKDQLSYELRGNSFLQKRDFESALSNFNELIKLDAKSILGNIGRAKVFFSKKEYDKAIEEDKQILSIDSLNHNVYTQLARAYFIKKQFDLAIQNYSRAIQINPKIAKNYLYRGKAYKENNETSLAIKDYDEYVYLEKNVDALIARANFYIELKQSELALNDFSEAMRLYPKNTDSYIEKGKYYRLTGQYDLSMAEFSKALLINEKAHLAFIGKAKTLSQMGEYQLAIDNFNLGIQLSPNNSQACFDILSPLIRTRQLEKAKIYAEKYDNLVHQFYLENNETLFYSNYLISITDNLPNGKYEQALVNLDKSLNDYASNNTKNDFYKFDYLDLLSLKGYILDKLNRKKESKVIYTQSLALNDSQPEIKEALGQTSSNLSNSKIIVTPTTKIASNTVNKTPGPPAKEIITKADITPPNISITSPSLKRGLRIVQTIKEAIVTGKATDASGIFEVTINGIVATLQASGEFSATIPLSVGDNQLFVAATDTKNNKRTLNFTINRAATEVVVQKEIPIVAAVVPQNETPIMAISSKELKPEGKYYALIIGIEDYLDESINKLDQPIKDANSLYEVLLDKYTFNKEDINFLKNPTRVQLFEALEQLSIQVKPIDNVLIFYAGHGLWDESRKQGYWFPADAKKTNRSSWLSNADLKDYIKGVKSIHTLLISDACFSGGIFKSRAVMTGASRAIKELYDLPSRKAMTSGTLKEVPDQSVFIKFLVKRLQSNTEKYMLSEQLYSSLRTAVINNSSNGQVPQFGEIKETGDEGGDFVFIKK